MSIYWKISDDSARVKNAWLSLKDAALNKGCLSVDEYLNSHYPFITLAMDEEFKTLVDSLCF